MVVIIKWWLLVLLLEKSMSNSECWMRVRRESGKKNQKKNGKDQAERTPFSESPGREMPGPKSSARTELNEHIFGQIENFGAFCIISHDF